MKKNISNPYHKIESICLKLDPKQNLQHLVEESIAFASSSEEIQRIIEKFQKKISNHSLLSVILFWAQRKNKDHALGKDHLLLLANLMEEELFPPKKNMTLKEFSHLDHESIISKIRSHEKWNLQDREQHVSFYLGFINSVAELTYGLFPSITDLDRYMTERRRLPFEAYLKLLAQLPDRERILTKLFYLGGERTLDEVLSLEIKNIDFAGNQIAYPDHAVRYPKHVLDDIRSYISDRKKGFIFIGKHGERINHTVPYRALKTAAKKLNLPSTFTFKDLVKEQ